jgi:hypothetical protein
VTSILAVMGLDLSRQVILWSESCQRSCFIHPVARRSLLSKRFWFFRSTFSLSCFVCARAGHSQQDIQQKVEPEDKECVLVIVQYRCISFLMPPSFPYFFVLILAVPCLTAAVCTAPLHQHASAAVNNHLFAYLYDSISLITLRRWPTTSGFHHDSTESILGYAPSAHLQSTRMR